MTIRNNIGGKAYPFGFSFVFFFRLSTNILNIIITNSNNINLKDKNL